MGFNSLQVGYKQNNKKFAIRNRQNCFNSLQVGYKQSTFVSPKTGKLQFQFLIGWLQTKKKAGLYARLMLQFQFLIGWLQTTEIPIEDIEEFLFQFLIGWLQTDNTVRMAIILPKFQFLIGWLQTEFQNNVEPCP